MPLVINADSPAYIEVLDFIVSSITPEALLQFRPSEASQRRLSELMEREHTGTLSPDEAVELNEYLQIEHLMIMAKAQARIRLQLAGGNERCACSARCRASRRTDSKFDPRRDRWSDHFRLERAVIEPLTPTGEVTARLLRLNLDKRVIERSILIAAGRYP